MRTRALLRLDETDAADRLSDECGALADLALAPRVFASRRHAVDVLGVGAWNHCYDMNDAGAKAIPSWGGVELIATASSPRFRQPGMRPGSYSIGVGFDAYNTRQLRASQSAQLFDVGTTTDIAWLLAIPKRALFLSGTYLVIKSGFVGGPDWYLSANEVAGIVWTVDDGPNAVSVTVPIASVPGPNTPCVVGCVLERGTARIRLGVCPIGGAAVVTAEANVAAVGSLSNAASVLISHGENVEPLHIGHMMACHGVSAAAGVSANLPAILERYAAAVSSIPQVVDAYAGRGRDFVALSGNGFEGVDVNAGDTVLTRDCSVQALVKWDLASQGAATSWSIRKVSGGGGWDAGASSAETIAGDGCVEIVVADLTSSRMIGLSTVDADANYTSIQYALHHNAAVVDVYELGVPKSAGTPISIGDVLRVERVGSTITYRKNGAVFYTSLALSSAPLRVDSAITTLGAGFDAIRFYDAGVRKSISWQNVENATLTPMLNVGGTLYSRGGGALPLSAGVELRPVNAAAGVGEFGWTWQGPDGVLRRQVGGLFAVPDGYTLLTATRRWESPTKIVLRHYVGATLVGETETSDAVDGAASAPTVIGARRRGRYPTSAAELTQAGGGIGGWQYGHLLNEGAGNISPAFGAGPTFTPVGGPTYGIDGPLFDGVDKAIQINAIGRYFQYAGPSADFSVGVGDDLIVGAVCRLNAEFANAEVAIVVDKSGVPGWRMYWYRNAAGSAGLAAYFDSGAGPTFVTVDTGGPLPIGQWVFATLAWSRASQRARVCWVPFGGGATVIGPLVNVAAIGNVTNANASQVLGGAHRSVDYAAWFYGKGPSVALGAPEALESITTGIAEYIAGSYGDFFDGVIDELRVTDYELSPEEIEATWRRISEHQPDGERRMRDLMPPNIPISDDPSSRAQTDLRSMGQALGYAAAQVENFRENVMPDRAYGEMQERWERITKQFAKPLESLDRRRRRVLAHLGKRAGVAIKGVRNALRDLLATNERNVEIVAFDQTIAEDWLRLRAERWLTTGAGVTLLKNAGAAAYDSGAAASEFFGGDCFVEWIINSTAQTRTVGLTSESAYSVNPATYDYAVACDANMIVNEDGVGKATVLGIAVGDMMRIERRGSTVYYRRNGAIVYTSTAPSTQPLRVVVSVATVGGSIQNLRAGTELANYIPLVWVERTGNLIAPSPAEVDSYGARLVKTGGAVAWDAGASSVESIAGDGYVEFVATSVADVQLGFGVDDASTLDTDTEYGWRLTGGGSVIVKEGAASPFAVAGPGAFVAGDVFRVERIGSTIRYLQNGALKYTSAIPSSGALFVDASLNAAASSLDNVRLYDAGVRKSITWQNAVNVRATGDSLRIQNGGGSGLTWDLDRDGGLRAVMTSDEGLTNLVGRPQEFNGHNILVALEPVALPANAEAGLVFWDWAGRHLFFFGLRNTMGSGYQVGYQRYRSDGVSDAAWQVLAATSLTKHWLRLRPAIGDSFVGTIVEQAYDLSWSTTGSAEADFATSAGVMWRRNVSWIGCYVRSFGLPATQIDVRFAESKFRNVAGSRPFFFYALRDRNLAGDPDFEAARGVVRRMRHAYTHASVIAQRSFLADDPYSVTDGGPLGGI